MFLTEEEIIAGSVTQDRFFEVLTAENTVVTKCSVGKNSVGEFLFIRIKWRGNSEFYVPCTRCKKFHIGPYPGVSFFGMGFDEKERCFFETDWRFHGATSVVIDTGVVVPRVVVLQEIEKRRPMKLPQLQPA